MAHSYPEPTKTRFGVLFLGVGVALSAFILGWLARLWVEPSSSVESGTTAPRTESPPGQSAVAGPHDDLLTRCQQVYAAQDAPLAAGAASMTQWTEHIAAMNKLVAGEIGLDQATAFWEQTRVGAQERLDAYAAAVSLYDGRTVRCPHAAALEADDPLPTCRQAVVARNQQLAVMRTALDTWQTHVRHMEMLRHGEMSPSRAVRLWLNYWRQGQSEVRAYRDTAQATQGLQC